MEPEVEDVLRRVSQKLPAGCTLVELDLQEAMIAMDCGGRREYLHFLHQDLGSQFAQIDDVDRKGLWGLEVSQEETVARLISIHLEESLAMREPPESGHWTYLRSGFEPIPPWQAHKDRTHRRR
ncbi:hypothetical protein [Kineococcus terrestris]|uniref:hypothetical protein n=1 Tax=Kineococcus terrestris TaxID=2044856 RepID=UPI0034DABD1D